jgi:hypothetical protein
MGLTVGLSHSGIKSLLMGLTVGLSHSGIKSLLMGLTVGLSHSGIKSLLMGLTVGLSPLGIDRLLILSPHYCSVLGYNVYKILTDSRLLLFLLIIFLFVYSQLNPIFISTETYQMMILTWMKTLM